MVNMSYDGGVVYPRMQKGVEMFEYVGRNLFSPRICESKVVQLLVSMTL